MRDFDIWFNKDGQAEACYLGVHLNDITNKEREILHQEFQRNMKAQYGKNKLEPFFRKEFKAGVIMVIATFIMLSTELQRIWLDFLLDVGIASIGWYYYYKILGVFK